MPEWQNDPGAGRNNNLGTVSMTAIEIEQLSKTFGGRAALRNVSLRIMPGEMVALIGASGSGKSTLIRHISGLVKADASGPGKVVVHGRPIQERGALVRGAKEIRSEIGLIFQQFNLVGRLSVLTNVLTGLLGRVPPSRGTLNLFTRQEKLLAMHALTRVGIAEKARQRATDLSGGQQQRAAIARAMVQGARVILADEPIASLDPASAKRVMESLAALNDTDGVTVLVSLHQVEYARRYCPRTIALRDGEIAYDGPSHSLSRAALQELYGDASEELILPEATQAPRPQTQVAARLETAVA